MEGFDQSISLYHGTDAEFTKFDTTFARTARDIYTSPDPKTASAYGSHVYLVHPKVGARIADVNENYDLQRKLIDALYEDFLDDARYSPEGESLHRDAVRKLTEQGIDEIDAEEKAEELLKPALEKMAKSLCQECLTGGRVYDRSRHLQDDLMGECFELGYDAVQFYDSSSTGAPLSIVFDKPENLLIVRTLSEEEINSSFYQMEATRPNDYWGVLVESLNEKYTENNRHLLNYMKNGDEFDPYPFWSRIASWLIENYPDETNEAAGKEVTWDELDNWYEADFFYKLPPHIQKECADDMIGTVMHFDPADAPTTAHMSLNKNRLLPRTTWLIHYSDHAYDIALNGFKYGMDEMDKLGLTTWFKDEAKKYGGYNFAFDAKSRYAEHGQNYGREAVMFMNSGVECSHHGDQEDQVIFWGADVDPRDIIYLCCDGGTWGVGRKHGRGQPVFQADDIGTVIKWVIKHSSQYRRSIGIR